jgi:hypothetical protein
MKWVSTTIKKVWMDEILAGRKCIEYKDRSEYWKKRLEDLAYNVGTHTGHGINFLCGRKSYKFRIDRIEMKCGAMIIDNKPSNSWYEIHIGLQFRQDELSQNNRAINAAPPMGARHDDATKAN